MENPAAILLSVILLTFGLLVMTAGWRLIFFVVLGGLMTGVGVACILHLGHVI